MQCDCRTAKSGKHYTANNTASTYRAQTKLGLRATHWLAVAGSWDSGQSLQSSSPADYVLAGAREFSILLVRSAYQAQRKRVCRKKRAR